MHSWERRAAIIGALVGAVLCTSLAWLFVDDSSLWTAAILGAAFGLMGGALGQGFIEGIYVAIICTVFLMPLLLADLPPTIREIGIGFLGGEAVGWLTHGLGKRKSRRT